MRSALCILLAATMVAAPALAQDLPRASPEATDDVVALERDKPAPFTGLLVTEDRFKQYVAQQERAEKAEASLAVTSKQRDDCVKSDEACKARCPEDGSADGKRKFWLGATTGAVITTIVLGAIAYGIVEAAKALNK